MKSIFIILITFLASTSNGQINMYQRFGFATPEKVSIGLRFGNENWKTGFDLGGYNGTNQEKEGTKTVRTINLLHQRNIKNHPIYIQGNVGYLKMKDPFNEVQSPSIVYYDEDDIREATLITKIPNTTKIMAGTRMGFEWEFYDGLLLDVNVGTIFTLYQRDVVKKTTIAHKPSEYITNHDPVTKKTYPITGEFVSNVGILFKLF